MENNIDMESINKEYNEDKGFDKIIKTQYDNSFDRRLYIPEEYVIQRLCDGIGVEIHKAIKEDLIRVDKEGNVFELRIRVIQN